MDCNPFHPSVRGESGQGESSKEEGLSESVVELRLEGRVRGLRWVERVEYCPVLIAEVECDEVVRPVVPGAVASGYRVRVLVGVAGEEVSVIFPSMWCLPEVKHLIYFLMLQQGD